MYFCYLYYLPSIMNKIKHLQFIFAFLFFCLGLLGCEKDPDLNKQTAYISIHNASINSLDFYIYNSTAPRNNPVNSADLQRGAATGYLGVYDGLWNFEAILNDSASTTLIKEQQLIGNQYLSFFVTNTDSLDFLIINDDLNQRNASRPKIKFLNLSPNAGPLSLEFVLLSQSISFPSTGYKNFTPYQEFDERSSYQILLRNAAKGILLETEQNFERGKLYTIWTTGLINTTVSAQQLRLHITEVK